MSIGIRSLILIPIIILSIFPLVYFGKRALNEGDWKLGILAFLSIPLGVMIFEGLTTLLEITL